MQRWRRDLLAYAEAFRVAVRTQRFLGRHSPANVRRWLGAARASRWLMRDRDWPMRHGAIRTSWAALAESLAWDGVDVRG